MNLPMVWLGVMHHLEKGAQLLGVWDDVEQAKTAVDELLSAHDEEAQGPWQVLAEHDCGWCAWHLHSDTSCYQLLSVPFWRDVPDARADPL